MQKVRCSGPCGSSAGEEEEECKQQGTELCGPFHCAGEGGCTTKLSNSQGAVSRGGFSCLTLQGLYLVALPQPLSHVSQALCMISSETHLYSVDDLHYRNLQCYSSCETQSQRAGKRSNRQKQNPKTLVPWLQATGVQPVGRLAKCFQNSLLKYEAGSVPPTDLSSALFLGSDA